jgi:hypothetical protein
MLPRNPISARFTLSTKTKVVLALLLMTCCLAAIIATTKPSSPNSSSEKTRVERNIDASEDKTEALAAATSEAKSARSSRVWDAGKRDRSRRILDCPYDPNCQTGEGYKDQLERFMPVPGGESDDLDRLEAEWHNRLTYPTGVFDPSWVRPVSIIRR